ncbi:hypothetical protein EJB05_35524, partial [Eragrostis curvula]
MVGDAAGRLRGARGRGLSHVRALGHVRGLWFPSSSPSVEVAATPSSCFVNKIGCRFRVSGRRRWWGGEEGVGASFGFLFPVFSGGFPVRAGGVGSKVFCLASTTARPFVPAESGPGGPSC